MFLEPVKNPPTNQITENLIDLHWRSCAANKYDIAWRFMVLFCNVTRQIRVIYLLLFFETEVLFA